MKKLLLAFCLVGALLCHVSAAEKSAGNPVPFADPFILCEGGKYYAYGTHSPSGIAVAVSSDLKVWRVPEGNKSGLALNQADSFGNRWFWAPEVYRVGEKYCMYYSADLHICVATSDSPVGPFKQAKKEPMLKEEWNIDCSLFVDDDGKPYLFWVHSHDGNEVWAAELEADCMTIRQATAHRIVRATQPWECKTGRTNEGPFVLKHKGTYYLTYSGNDFRSPLYGLGCATASSISGPWTKYVDNPILQHLGGLNGTGHHAFFTDKTGVKRIVFHSHLDARHVLPRIFHIGTYSFEKQQSGPDRLVIGKEFFTPTME